MCGLTRFSGKLVVSREGVQFPEEPLQDVLAKDVAVKAVGEAGQKQAPEGVPLIQAAGRYCW